jgi:hypothetical protein
MQHATLDACAPCMPPPRRRRRRSMFYFLNLCSRAPWRAHIHIICATIDNILVAAVEHGGMDQRLNCLCLITQQQVAGRWQWQVVLLTAAGAARTAARWRSTLHTAHCANCSSAHRRTS